MSIIQGSAMQGASRSFYPFEISNSLRFNDDDSPFLSFTPTSAGTEEKFTFSCWVKRGNLSSGEMYFFSAGHSNFNNFGGLEFLGNEIAFQNYNSGTQVISRTGNTLFRDTAAWYNIVWQFDSTDNDPTDGTDRARLYVNGTQITAFTGNVSNLTHNYISQFNTAVQHTIGCRQAASQDAFFDGYLAEVNFIDGGSPSSDASDFGELKENIWIPKDTSGLYASAGANSFRLEFKNSSVGSASSSTVGADTSGKNNHFSSTNIATTDNTTDSPTDNHATFNPEIIMMNNASSYRGIGSFSDGNLLLTTDADNESGTVPFGATSGKYYMEFTSVTLGNRQQIMVFSRDDFRGDTSGGAVTSSSDGGGNATGRDSWTSGDVIGIAVDLDNSKVFFAKNNNYFGSSNPATNTGGDSLSKLTGVGVRHDSGGTNTTTIRFNGGQLAFTHSPPSGFKSLSTASLPAPSIDPAEGENPLEYWDAQLHTGDSSTQEISKFAFQPDWVWIKNRDNADNHYTYDSVRGATKTLHIDIDSTSDKQEFTSSNALTSFDSDGFTTGGDGGTNRDTQGYVAWAWKAGTSFSNSAGSNGANSDSAGTVSTEAGFSVITYTGNGSSSNAIAHGLGATPQWMLIKARTADTAWVVNHHHLGMTSGYMNLNTNGAFAPAGNNIVAIDSTTFSVGTDSHVNGNTIDFVAYCFAEKEGYSKFGSYLEHFVSDYDVDSPYVHTGFRPGWLMIKSLSTGRDWVIFDNKRTPDDGVYLVANNNGVEQTDATNHDISFLSNGFKIRGGSGDINTTNETYLYMCFADQPFKFANGGTE
jgi:hypothetical protein